MVFEIIEIKYCVVSCGLEVAILERVASSGVGVTPAPAQSQDTSQLLWSGTNGKTARGNCNTSDRVSSLLQHSHREFLSFEGVIQSIE